MQPKVTNTLTMPLRGHFSVLHVALPREGAAIHILGFIVGVLAVGYVALVSVSVVNVIARKEATDKTAALRADVSSLEHEYFELSQKITAGSGTALGMIPVSDTSYVHVPGSVGAADGVRNEI